MLRSTILGLMVGCLAGGAAFAQPSGRPNRPAAAPAPAPAPAPAGDGSAAAPGVPAGTPVPEQTTAVYGDWVLRCARLPNGPQTCEVIQAVQREGRTLAQMAVGRPVKGAPMQFTLLVPHFVSLLTAPVLTGGVGRVELAWNKCLPVGCVAASPVTDEQLSRIRAGIEPMQVGFNDGNARAVTLPVSPKGFSEAMDALGKADAG